MKKIFKKAPSLILSVILFAVSFCFSSAAANKITAPKNVKATSTTSSITLSWSKVADADFYRIYYKNSNDEGWKTAVTKTTGTSKTFEKLPSAKRYYFAVRSFKKVKNSAVYSDMKEVRFATSPKAPQKITSTQTNKSITLKWSKVEGATHYRVYQKINGEWKNLGTSTKCSRTITELKGETKYTFAVRSYIKTKSYSVAGESKSISATTQSAVPNVTGLKFEQGTEYKKVKKEGYTYYGDEFVDKDYAYTYVDINGVKLLWNKVKNATGYRVFVYKNNKWTKLSDTKNTNYLVKNLTPGKVYKFAVKAYMTKNNKTTFSSEYISISAASQPNKTTVSLQAKNKSVVITWAKTTCSGYLLYICNNPADYSGYGYKKTVIKGSSNTSYVYKYPDYAHCVSVIVKPYSETDNGKITYYDYDVTEERVTPYATKTDGNIKIKPIESAEAKKIQEKFYNYRPKKDRVYYEGKSADGKNIVVYLNWQGEWSGTDAAGRWYDTYGKTEICPYCDLVRGDGKNLCNGGCHLSFS